MVSHDINNTLTQISAVTFDLMGEDKESEADYNKLKGKIKSISQYLKLIVEKKNKQLIPIERALLKICHDLGVKQKVNIINPENVPTFSWYVYTFFAITIYVAKDGFLVKLHRSLHLFVVFFQ